MMRSHLPGPPITLALRLSRRAAIVLLLPLLAACGGGLDGPAPVDPPADPHVAWLQANAHPIRSLSVSDRDFSDLQPLKAAIGSSRVVLLGEQSHGDGTTFLAKARLIAFLHQEMGFDVLAWESGLWDVRQLWRHVQAGEAVIPASRRGIFGVWTGSQEVLPTLDYVAETLGTARPLEMAGFDNQLTGSLARDSLHLLVEAFGRRIGSAVPNDPEWPAAAATLHHLAQTLDYDTKPSAADQARLLRLLAALRADAQAKAGSDRDALFWAQSLESIASFAEVMWSVAPGESTVAQSNQRDAQIGRNLVWLANVWYPDRKIIVWAASAHIARAVGLLRTDTGYQPYLGGWNRRMGGEAYAQLGEQMYAIGFTAGSGSFVPLGLDPIDILPPRAGSLEATAAAAGLENAFIDLRTRPAGGDWLQDVYARPFGYGELAGDWTRVLDGMVYTRVMAPRTNATR